ncbi:sugar transporter SWEET1-like isoform X1 [Haliotis rubra]|uniref:sugar transporter SWEET1-like isoform X1 n=2 Tax=Haliotis rubra TaxID=36100 RepID=UPI001EE5AAD7|nr:sugar transporter SWEET1-like isoform X1 [Haliotis rubra]
MDFFHIVEWSTIIFTILMMMSGIPPCVSMYKTQETKNIPFFFFLICLMNSMIGLYYGVLIDNGMLKMLNILGTALWGIYIFVYILVAQVKSDAVSKVTGMFALFLSHVVYLVYIVQRHDEMVAWLGSMLFVWTNVLVIVPAWDIVEVVRRKSSEGVSVSVLMGGLMCSFVWLLYGYLLNDFNIYAPNIPGVIINVTRLVLLIAYRGGGKAKVE